MTVVRPTRWMDVRASTLLVPAVVAVVLGILGMHGLGTHGSAGATAAGTPAVDTAPVTVVHHTTSHSAAHSAAHSADHSVVPPSSHADQHDHGAAGSMVMLCVAVLAGAATALVVLLVGRSWPAAARAARARRARGSQPRPALLRIGTGPPDVWRFSVVRC